MFLRRVSIFLLPILLLVSCVNNDRTVGGFFVPADQDLTIAYESLKVPVGMRASDSIQSTSYYFMLGNNINETFGLTKIGLAGSVTFDADSVSKSNPFGTDPKFVSMYLYFSLQEYTTFAEGQQAIPQNITVYPLKKALTADDIYCSAITDDSYDHTPINTESVVYFGDSEITINLSESFGSKFFTLTQAELDTASLLVKKIPGLYLEMDEPMEGYEGGRINYFSEAGVVFTYNSTNAAGRKRDTTIVLAFGGTDGLAIQRIEQDRKKFEVGSDNNLKTLYYEGLAGVKPHISAKDIKKVFEKWAADKGIDLKNVLFSRVSLELPFEFPDDLDEMDTYPSALYPCLRDTLTGKGHRYSLLATIYSSEYDHGTINRSLKYYRPDITDYVQDLLTDDKIDETDDLWLISPYEYTTSSSSSSDYYNNYNYYYDPYGYGYGYGGYGYGSSYYNNYYNYYNYYNSSSSSQTYYYADCYYYSMGRINGNGAERAPKIVFAYSVFK